MEAAVYLSVTHTAAVPSTLITSFVSGEDVSLGGRDAGGMFIDQPSLLQATIARDVVTIPGPLFIVGEHATFLPSGWVTVITQSHHNPQWAPPGNSVLSISIPALAILEVSVKTSSTPIITPIPIPNAATQLGAELALVDPIGLCTINTAPLDQQQSSYEDCQRTIAPGGICCIPGVPDPPDGPSKTSASTPASAPASPTSTPSSSSTSTSKSLTTPTPKPTRPAPSTFLPSSAPASKPSTPAPMPTEIVPPKHKTPILPILIPCSLAAIGIVAFGIWCIMWRSRGPRHPPAPSVAMAPKVVNGQKVFEAGNFAGAEAFERGIGEMARKEKANDGGGGKWKRGYRKYRESGTGSGLLG